MGEKSRRLARWRILRNGSEGKELVDEGMCRYSGRDRKGVITIHNLLCVFSQRRCQLLGSSTEMLCWVQPCMFIIVEIGLKLSKDHVPFNISVCTVINFGR